jgi:hypothetical protein
LVIYQTRLTYNEFDLPSLQEVVDTIRIFDVIETEEDDDDVPGEDITTILEEPHSEIPILFLTLTRCSTTSHHEKPPDEVPV